jgi:hypothetical protein
MCNGISRFASFSPACLSFVSLGAAQPMPLKVGIFGGIFMLANVALWGGLGVYFFRQSYKKSKWKAAYGTVVAFQRGGRREVAFEAPNGQKVAFTESSCAGRNGDMGRKVKVLYNPDDPTQADIPTMGMWFAPLFLLLLATVALFMSVVFFCGPFMTKK